VSVEWSAVDNAKHLVDDWKRVSQVFSTMGSEELHPLFLQLVLQLFDYRTIRISDQLDGHWSSTESYFDTAWQSIEFPIFDHRAAIQGNVRRQVREWGAVCLAVIPEEVRESIAQVRTFVADYLTQVINYRLELAAQDELLGG